MAKPLIAISVKAEMDVAVKEGSKSVTKRIAAKDVIPGDVIFYTVNFRNEGNEKATNAVIDNPISKATGYVDGSAYGESENGITFSIDKGKTYRPTMLFYQITDKQEKLSRGSLLRTFIPTSVELFRSSRRASREVLVLRPSLSEKRVT